MSLFTKILEKVGLKKPAAAPAAPAATAAKPAAPVAKPAAPAPVAKPATSSVSKDERDNLANREMSRPAEVKPAAISEVDVVAKLEQMASGSELNWKVSIVDLLKVLGLDADKNARIELAKELNCPAELIGGDYTKMNVWLHKEVLKQMAQNGGNIPKELLD